MDDFEKIYKSNFWIFVYNLRNGSFNPNLTLFWPLFSGFWPISQLIDENSKTALVNFFQNHPKSLYFKFQTNSLTVAWENMANIIFRGGQKGQKSEKMGKKGHFFQVVSYLTTMILSVVPQRVSISNLRSFEALI